MSEPIEYPCKDVIICPHCKVDDRTAWERVLTDGEEYEYECLACDNVYTITRHVSITYSSKPINNNRQPPTQ